MANSSNKCNLVPPLEAFPNYKGWTVQICSIHYDKCSLGPPSEITGSFRCIRFPQLSPMFLNSRSLSLQSLHPCPPVHLIFPALIPTYSQSTSRSILFPLLREVYVFPLKSSSLFNLSESMNSNQYSIYFSLKVSTEFVILIQKCQCVCHNYYYIFGQNFDI